MSHELCTHAFRDVLRDVCVESEGPRFVNMNTLCCHAGFSEYASYVSWARYRHPGSQRLAAKRTWLRYGVGGGGAIRLLRHASRDGVCCPTVASIAAARLLGYTCASRRFGFAALGLGPFPGVFS